MYGIVFLAIREDRTYVYPNFIIIGAVLFAVWRAGSAVYHLLHFRRQKSPVLLSAKALSLSAALLSLFALQGTLLSRFGRSLARRAAWNGISGSFIGILITVMALMMIRKAKKRPPD
jgi:divalent metal cation (Fe/Co/Zn/Cd) transporter